MASIDVSFLLTDPDFADTITVTRTAQTVGSNGRATNTTTTFASVVAVVQPAGGQALRLLPEGARAEGAIQIYTTFALQPVAAGFAGDQITWQGNHYVVSTTNEFTNWGSGYTAATCTLKDLVG